MVKAFYSFKNDLPNAKAVSLPLSSMTGGKKLQMLSLLISRYLRESLALVVFNPNCLKINGKKEVVMSLLLYSQPIDSRWTKCGCFWLSDSFLCIIWLSCACRLFSGIRDLYPLDASCPPFPKVVTSSDVATFPLKKGKIVPDWEPLRQPAETKMAIYSQNKHMCRSFSSQSEVKVRRQSPSIFTF